MFSLHQCTGNNALHQAAIEDQPEICRVLIQDGKARVNVLNPDGDSPLHLAVAAGNIESSRVLITEGKADVNSQNNVRFDQLSYICDMIKGNESDVADITFDM